MTLLELRAYCNLMGYYAEIDGDAMRAKLFLNCPDDIRLFMFSVALI